MSKNLLQSNFLKAAIVSGMGLVATPAWAQPAAPKPDSRTKPADVDAQADAEMRAAVAIKGLQHPDGAIRQAAANRIQELTGSAQQKAIAALLQNLDTGSNLTATLSAAVLQQLKLDREAEMALMSQLRQRLELSGLGSYRQALAIKLMQQISDESATATTKFAETFPALARAIQQNDAFRPVAAEQAVLSLLDRLTKLQSSDDKQDRKAAQAVAVQLQSSRPQLIAALHARCGQPRMQGLEVVIEEKVVTTARIGYIRRTRTEDRLLTARALTALQADTSLLNSTLQTLIFSSNPYVAVDACRLAGELPADSDLAMTLRAQAAKRLIELAAAPGSRVAEDAALALGAFDDSAATTLPLLTQLLTNRDAAVRVAAAQSLGDLGTRAQAALPSLREALAFEKLSGGKQAEVMQQAIDNVAGKDDKTDEAETK